VLDILEEVTTCASDILEGGNFLEIDTLRFLVLFPEAEVVDVLFKGLTVFDWRRLTFPSFFAEVLTFRQIQGCSQATIEILNDTEVLLLNSRSNLKDRASSEFGIGQSMKRVNDTTCCHDLSIFQGRVFCKVGGNSEGDGPQQRATCTTKEGFFSGANSRVRVHELIGIHEGVHGVCGRHSHTSCLQNTPSDLFSQG